MPTVNKLLRTFRAEVTDLGLEIVDERHGNHRVFRLRNRHGVVASIPMSLSPSDSQRAHKNKLAQLRRFAAAKTWGDYNA